MDQKRIIEVYHMNILINNITKIVTKEKYSISTLGFWNIDEIATTLMDYASNEMAHTKHSNHNSYQSEAQYPSAKKYPLLTQFLTPTNLLNPH